DASRAVSTFRLRLGLRFALPLRVLRLVAYILEEGVQDVDLGLAAFVPRADFFDVPIEELRQSDRARFVEIDAPALRAISESDEYLLLRFFVGPRLERERGITLVTNPDEQVVFELRELHRFRCAAIRLLSLPLGSLVLLGVFQFVERKFPRAFWFALNGDEVVGTVDDRCHATLLEDGVACSQCG